jgi:hypothetical protein
MKAFLSLIVASMALVATDASAQYADLSGRYRCVQACRDGLVGQPAFITQYGTQMNLVNEAGEPSRGWTDWPGHIWAPNWNEGAIYSPDGMTIQFDRGTVWQRDLGQAVIVAPVGVAPVEQPAPRVKGKTQAKRGAPPPASAPVEAALGRTAFDGNWSVVINTESGACDPQYRFGFQIINGTIVYEGGGPANVQGQVSPNGAVWVSVSSGGQQATGQGRLARNGGGAGSWRGQGVGGTCAGNWQAARRG